MKCLLGQYECGTCCKTANGFLWLIHVSYIVGAQFAVVIKYKVKMLRLNMESNRNIQSEMN